MAVQKQKEKKVNTGEKNDLLRLIPKVDEFLRWVEHLADAPGMMIKSAIRSVLEEKRQAILAGNAMDANDLAREALIPVFLQKLSEKAAPI